MLLFLCEKVGFPTFFPTLGTKKTKKIFNFPYLLRVWVGDKDISCPYNKATSKGTGSALALWRTTIVWQTTINHYLDLGNYITNS